MSDSIRRKSRALKLGWAEKDETLFEIMKNMSKLLQELDYTANKKLVEEVKNIKTELPVIKKAAVVKASPTKSVSH